MVKTVSVSMTGSQASTRPDVKTHTEAFFSVYCTAGMFGMCAKSRAEMKTLNTRNKSSKWLISRENKNKEQHRRQNNWLKIVCRKLSCVSAKGHVPQYRSCRN